MNPETTVAASHQKTQEEKTNEESLPHTENKALSEFLAQSAKSREKTTAPQEPNPGITEYLALLAETEDERVARVAREMHQRQINQKSSQGQGQGR